MPKNTKVLMVDDDKMLLDMYKERLDLAGFQVETSSNGEECLAKIHQVKPDIVLLDIMMPKVNGYDTLASIKSDPQTKDIPVIILSALVRDINKSRAIEAGADDYIIKSEVMPADVIKKIENVLAKYHKDVTTDDQSPPLASPPSTTPPPASPPPLTPATPSKPVAPAEVPKESPPPAKPEPEIQFEPGTPKQEEKPAAQKSSSLPYLIIILGLLLVSIVFYWYKFIK